MTTAGARSSLLPVLAVPNSFGGVCTRSIDLFLYQDFKRPHLLTEVEATGHPRSRQINGNLRFDSCGRAGSHDGDASPKQQSLDDIMCDVNHGLLRLLPYARQLLLQATLRDRIERRKGLVHQQDLGLHDEGTRDLNALLHPAREFERKLAQVLGQSDHAQIELELSLVFGRSDALEPRPKQDIFPHVEPRKKSRRCILEDHGPVGAGAVYRGPPARRPLLAFDFDLAASGALKACYEVEDRALAASARPQQAIEITAADFDADIVERCVGAAV